MQNIGLLMNDDAQAIFNSCSVGRIIGTKNPLAKIFSKNSNLETFAPAGNIQDVTLKFENGRLQDVKYYSILDGDIPTRKFSPDK